MISVQHCCDCDSDVDPVCMTCPVCGSYALEDLSDESQPDCDHVWQDGLDGDGDAVADCLVCGERRYDHRPTIDEQEESYGNGWGWDN